LAWNDRRETAPSECSRHGRLGSTEIASPRIIAAVLASRRRDPGLGLGLGLGLVAGLGLLACHPSDPSIAGSTTPAQDVVATAPDDLALYIETHYDKREVRIPMRDGVELFTAIYTPKDATSPRPIMLKRTPYSVGPYGEQQFPSKLGPSELLTRKDWIFVFQDVRGRFMSGGQFVNMTPHRGPDRRDGQTDESTDTYDTVEWLLANVDGHNGKVGQWGISYPGFYAAAGMIDAHPALAAVSPQAPIADWFFDDFHHHGAFFLPHAFNFFATFGVPRDGPYQDWAPRFDHGTDDGYAFFMELGPLRNANDKYFHGEIAFWNDLVAHPNYDAFWQERNLLPHLKNVAPAVMTVGGWFDAEDLYGALHVYQALEAQNPDTFNVLVMGPWPHGGWSRADGRRLGQLDFGSDTSTFYQENIEGPFFEHHLAGGPAPQLPEAYVFETGANRWRTFEHWPPNGVEAATLYAGPAGALSTTAPQASAAHDEYVSDPSRPIPFTAEIAKGMTKGYMVEDQRFAARRPDVLVYRSEPLTEPVTMAGPLTAELWISSTGTDADFVVKLVDEYPPGSSMPDEVGDPRPFGHAQIMVRSEVIRARFRDGYTEPKPLRPGVPTKIALPLQDVLHTFEPGHRIMIQVQSSWFPMVDRNPQTFVPNIFLADDTDFVAATQSLWRDREHPSALHYTTLPTN
jgi:putative CocE/NonD family hydrolase